MEINRCLRVSPENENAQKRRSDRAITINNDVIKKLSNYDVPNIRLKEVQKTISLKRFLKMENEVGNKLRYIKKIGNIAML